MKLGSHDTMCALDMNEKEDTSFVFLCTSYR